MTHRYPVRVTWTGGRAGHGTVALEKGTQDVPISVPAEFHGIGSGTSPEELLASAVAGCYAVTLGIVAEHRKVPIVGLDVEAVGEAEQDGSKLTYTAVTIRPRLRLAPEASDEQAQQALELAHRADKYCLVTNAVRGSVKVVVEPELVRD